MNEKDAHASMQKIYQSLNTVVESLADGVVFADSQGHLLHFNPAALKIHGFNTLDEIFKQLNEYPAVFTLRTTNGEDLDLQDWPISRVLRKEKFVNLELELIRKDIGLSKIVNYSGTPIFDEANELILAVLTARDVTEMRSLESEVKYQGLLTKAITDNAASGLFMMDKMGHPTYMNPAAQEITGYENLDEVKHRPLHYAIHWKKPDGSYYPMEECPIDNAQAELKVVKNQEEIFCKKDGTLFPVSYSVMPLEKNGEVIGSVLEFRDVTEEKKAQLEIEEREAEFRSLANSIPQLAWMADSAGWIYWYNQRWYDYTGTTFEEMQGWGWEKVHHPDHIEQDVNFIKEAWNKAEPFELTFPLRSKDGEWRWFLTRAVPIFGMNRKHVKWFGTNTDVTDYLHIQEELQQKEKSLSEALIARDEFLSIASHELRTPITSLQLQLQMAKRAIESNINQVPSSDKLLRTYDLSITQVKRLTNLIESLLDVSRIQAGKVSFTFTKADFSKLVLEIVALYCPQLQLGECEIIQRSEEPIILSCDVYRIEQVIINLLTNAAKYGAGKPIQVEISKDEKYARLIIKDQGQGISKDNIEKIFDRFERATSHKNISGLGLGLYISKNIVLGHKGNLRVESDIGKGSSFILELPLEESK